MDRQKRSDWPDFHQSSSYELSHSLRLGGLSYGGVIEVRYPIACFSPSLSPPDNVLPSLRLLRGLLRVNLRPSRVAISTYSCVQAPLQIYTDSQVAMGDLAYNYLHHAQGDYFSDWLGLPLFSDDTSWSTNSFSPNPISEQLTTEFTMPSPSYVDRPWKSLHSLNSFPQGFSELLPFDPLTPTLRITYSGMSTTSTSSTRTGLPPGYSVFRERSKKMGLRCLRKILPWALRV